MLGFSQPPIHKQQVKTDDSPSASKPSKRLSGRYFLVILLITSVVWLGATMSESKNYPLQVHLQWSGYDTAQYVVSYADTVLPLTVTSDNFSAITRYLRVRREPFQINISGDTVIKVNTLLFDSIKQHYGFENFQNITSTADNIRIQLIGRKGRPYIPQLKNVNFTFTEQFGLSGAPRISPDTVWLYGNPAVLEKIAEVTTAPCSIQNISDSGYYTVPLNPIWQKYRDVRASYDSIRIYLPVERYVEQNYSIPVELLSHQGGIKAKLYPDHVTVTLWVPYKDYESITAEQIHAVAEYDPDLDLPSLPVRISKFPVNARVKNISPAELQFVIIQ